MTAGNGRFWNRMKILFMMIILIMSAAMLTACGGAGTQTEKNGSAESGSESSGSEKTGSESSGLEKNGSEKTKSEIDVAPKELINRTSWLKLIYG